MKPLQEAAVIAALAEEMREQGSWCGETHLQKAAYFLKEAFDTPLAAEFLLYKHGPFSFDLRGRLTSMQALGFMELVAVPAPYGPKLQVTELGRELQQRFPNTLSQHRASIAYIAERLDGRGVADLEKLATALYVRKNWPSIERDEQIKRMLELKPHLNSEEARWAFNELDDILTSAPTK